MEKFLKYYNFFWIHVILMVGAYLISPFLSPDQYDVWFKIEALAWCIPPVFLLYCFHDTPAYDVLLVWSFFSLNNVIDEFLFDPLKFGWNEISFAALTVIFVFNHHKNEHKL